MIKALKTYLDAPIGAAMADTANRLLLYWLLAGLFFLVGLAFWVFWQGPWILIAKMAFCTVYTLHVTLTYAVGHYLVDALVNRWGPGWGAYEKRTVAGQMIVWLGGFCLAYVAHRFLVKHLVLIYAPDIAHYAKAATGRPPGFFSVLVIALPLWLGCVLVTLWVTLKRQAHLVRARAGGSRTKGRAGSKDSARAPVPPGTVTLEPEDGAMACSSISHVTVEDHYSRIYFIDPREGGLRNRLVRIPLKGIMEKLPGEHFVQIHRSHVVNLAFVSRLAKNGRENRILLTVGGVDLPVSRHRLAEVKPRIEKADIAG